MNILHFSNYSVGSSVYNDLFHALGTRPEVSKQAVACVSNRGQSVNIDINSDIEVFSFSGFPKILAPFIIVKGIIKFVLLFFCSGFYLFLKRADLIHAHTVFSDGVVACISSFFFRKKMIVTVRATDLYFYTKYFPFSRNIARIVFLFSDKIVFPSQALKLAFEKIYGKGYAGKLLVVTNGVDPIYNRLLCVKKADKYRVVFVGNSSKNKNMLNVIKAVGVLCSKFNCQFDLDCFGVSEDQLPLDYRSYLDREPRICFHAYGMVTKERLLHEYNKGGVLAVPSYKETFGLVYIEALCCGMPVVFSSSQGVDGHISHEHGCSCDPSSVDSIADSIWRALALGVDTAASTLYRDNFSWANIAKKYCVEFSK